LLVFRGKNSSERRKRIKTHDRRDEERKNGRGKEEKKKKKRRSFFFFFFFSFSRAAAFLLFSLLPFLRDFHLLFFFGSIKSGTTKRGKKRPEKYKKYS
jgi:hypothetical protein